MSDSAGSKSADPPPAAPDSPAVAAAKESFELRKLLLERRRLGLDDQVARAEARAKVAKGSVEAIQAYLPSTLDIPVEKDTLTTQGTQQVSLRPMRGGQPYSRLTTSPIKLLRSRTRCNTPKC